MPGEALLSPLPLQTVPTADRPKVEFGPRLQVLDPDLDGLVLGGRTPATMASVGPAPGTPRVNVMCSGTVRVTLRLPESFVSSDTGRFSLLGSGSARGDRIGPLDSVSTPGSLASRNFFKSRFAVPATDALAMNSTRSDIRSPSFATHSSRDGSSPFRHTFPSVPRKPPLLFRFGTPRHQPSGGHHKPAAVAESSAG